MYVGSHFNSHSEEYALEDSQVLRLTSPKSGTSKTAVG